MKRILALAAVFMLILGCNGNGGRQGQETPWAPKKTNASGELIIYSVGYNSSGGDYTGGLTFNLTQKNNSAESEQRKKEESRNLGANISGFPEVDEEITVKVFDVGYGEAVLVKKGEFEALFDTGGKASAKELVQKLNGMGITGIEVVAITTDDEKRWGGLKEVLENFEIGEVWTNGAINTPEFTEEVVKEASERGIPIRYPQAGDSVKFAGMEFKILHPQEKRLEGNIDINSVVAKVSYGKFCIFLSSNMEMGIENQVMAGGNLKCGILKIAKYASGSATTSRLLSAINPKYALLSVGDNFENLPNPTIIERIRILGIPLYRTDLDGDITITGNASGNYKIEKSR